MTFTPMDLIGQFILCKSRDAIPEGWNIRQHGEWHLGSHPTLPVTDILATDSSRIGWLLGWAISPAGVMVKQTCSFNVRLDDANTIKQFESALYDHGGRWAAIFLQPDLQRFYLDACGSLAAVFSPRHEMVASTPTLVPYSRECDDDRQLIEAIMIPGHDDWYPFGLTPRRHVERVLPNHYLDLKAWQLIRHWPIGEVRAALDTRSAVREIASLVKKNISAVARDYKLSMSLTAGRDARVLLACARACIDRITLFTVAIPSSGGRRDARVAPKIARRFNLDHRSVPYLEPSEQEFAFLMHRNGWCVDGFHARMNATHSQLATDGPILLGPAGELGRSFHWRKGDTETTPVSPRDLVKHQERLLHKVDLPELENRACKWLDGVPTKNTLTIWGLLFNEQLNGCWFGPLLYGLVSNPFYIFPFCHRRVLDLMLSLPTRYRLEMNLEQDIIESEWPELLEFPFNWPMGWRKYTFFVTRRARSLWKRLSQSKEGERR